jgi:sulfur-carrier protein
MIKVVLPFHLRNLAGVGREITLEVSEPVTQRKIIDALEAEFPMLAGTVRDRSTKQRRPFVRFFACQEDLSHDDPDAEVPEPVAMGAEPFMVVGAMSGG